MKVSALVKRLRFKEFIKLSWILIQKPFYILPTLFATKQTIDICNERYGREHNLTGKPNAFRHALWNVLISSNVLKINKSIRKSTTWAKKITDLHEQLAPNDLLDKTMDLHNNKVGREIFRQNTGVKVSEFLQILDYKLKEAKGIKSFEEFKKTQPTLIYLN